MANFGSSDHSIGVLIKSDADLKGFKTTEGALDSMGGRFDSVGAKTIAFGVIMANALTKVGQATLNMGKDALASTATYEQSRIAFETMLGSASKAQGLMTDIANFAKTTPFELPEVVAGSKQLLAFGFAQEQLIPTMRKLGDLASGLGVPIGQLTNVFGQVRVAGRLMGQDLLQFTNAGVPMIEALSKTMKQPQTEIKKLVEQGKIGFPEVETALNSLTGEGSKFGGMMEKQSKTFNGVVSNIKDGFGQMMRSALGMTVAGDIIEGGLFDRIKRGAEKVMPLVQKLGENAGPVMIKVMESVGGLASSIFELGVQIGEYLGPKFVALWNTLSERLIPVLSDLWKNYIEPLLPVLGVALVGAIGLAIDAINLLVTAFSGVVDFIANNQMIVLPLVGALATLWTAMKVQAGFTALTNGLSLLTNTTIPAVMTKFSALSGLIASPIVMPAIVIGAALLALNALIDKWRKTVEEVNGQASSHGAGTTSFYQSLKAGVAAGKFSQAEANRRMSEYNKNFKTYTDTPFLASGGQAMSGQAHVVGEEGPELFVPNRSGTVIPNKESAQLMGGSSTGGANITNNITAYLQSPGAVDRFFEKLDRDNELESKGLTPVRAM